VPLSAFREVWCCDTEFNGAEGELKRPVCLVAKEGRTGREVRLWRDELHRLKRAPFDVGPTSLFVAFLASAELGTFLQLGWPLPVNVLDLYAEHRVLTNGLVLPTDNSMLGACALRGIPSVTTAARKDAMRKLIMGQDTWNAAETQEIFDYCGMDVTDLGKLLRKMITHIDMPRALLRGRYMAAVAHMEHRGIPVDLPLLNELREHWSRLKLQLIRDVDQQFNVYEGTTFKAHQFMALTKRLGILWPQFDSGVPLLDNDTFKEQARSHPSINALHELRSTIGKFRLTGLEVGRDGRNRCMLSPFQSSTGRNQPSNSKFLFGPAVWMRGLMRPPEGYGLAYIDFSAQEIAIAAALSGDERMIADYESGDSHMGFAIAAGLAPAGATKKTHPHLEPVRDRCKVVNLGVLYGMEARGAAARLSIALVEADELLRQHRRIYPRFWGWCERTVDTAMNSDHMIATFGWMMRVRAKVEKARPGRKSDGVPTVRPTTLMNWQAQSNGSEMLRLACIAAVEVGIELVCPVHDAVVIQAPLDRLDQDIARMQALMTEAGRIVTGGLSVRTEATVVRWPDRYMDKRGKEMWARVMRLLGDCEQGAASPDLNRILPPRQPDLNGIGSPPERQSVTRCI
jgi:DNA polymerase I